MYDAVGWDCTKHEDQERIKALCADHWNRGWSTQDDTERTFMNMAAWQLPQLIERVRYLENELTAHEAADANTEKQHGRA